MFILYILGLILSLGIALFGTRLLVGRPPFWTEIVMSVLSLATLCASFGIAWDFYHATYALFLYVGLILVTFWIIVAQATDFITCFKRLSHYTKMKDLLVIIVASVNFLFLQHDLLYDTTTNISHIVVLTGTLLMTIGACDIDCEDPLQLRVEIFVSHLVFSVLMFCPLSWFATVDEVGQEVVLLFVLGACVVTNLLLLARLNIVTNAH